MCLSYQDETVLVLGVFVVLTGRRGGVCVCACVLAL